MVRFQDEKTGKFVSKAEAERRNMQGIREIGGGTTFNESFEAFVKERAKEDKISEKEVVAELFSREFMVVEFDEATGKASLKVFAGVQETDLKTMTNEKLLDEYRDLRENFAPVSAGIEYHKTFLCGAGFNIISDDPSDKHKIEMRDNIRDMCRKIYMDYYRKGLDRLLYIMADDLLTFGAAGAEIVYGRDIQFEEFATLINVVVKGKTVQKLLPIHPDKLKIRDWKGLKGITRLKIIDNSITRLTPTVDSKSGELLYWTLDKKMSAEEDEIKRRTGIKTSKEATTGGIKFHPFEIFWLSWNTRGTALTGQSIIRPALEIARLVRRIQKAIGKGFDRWAERKFFFVCGTEKRPWSKNALRKFMRYLELMIKHHWTGVPVPAGFDVKEIGGQVFEGVNILNHLINMICAAMNYPRDFLEQGRTRAGDKAWLAWQVKYGSNQRQLRRDMEHQLFEKHLWCNFGKRYSVPKQNVQPKNRERRDIYIPKTVWNAEGRWQRAEEIKTLISTLNVANPIGPEMKLAVEKRLAEILGFGSVQFPTFQELRREMKRMAKMEELMLEKQLKAKIEKPKKTPQEKRQEGGVSKDIAPTGKKVKPPPKVGGTRQPKIKKKGMPSKS